MTFLQCLGLLIGIAAIAAGLVYYLDSDEDDDDSGWFV